MMSGSGFLPSSYRFIQPSQQPHSASPAVTQISVTTSPAKRDSRSNAVMSSSESSRPSERPRWSGCSVNDPTQTQSSSFTPARSTDVAHPYNVGCASMSSNKQRTSFVPNSTLRGAAPSNSDAFTNRLALMSLSGSAVEIDGSEELSNGRNSDSIFKSEKHAKELAKKIEGYYSSEELADVRLFGADGQRVGSYHRVVLAASSDYFAAMFTGGLEEQRQPEVRIHDIDAATLKALLHYCYIGELRVEEWNVEALLSGACLLQLTEVIDACSQRLVGLLHPTNCIGIRHFAQAHGCVALHATANAYLLGHFNQVVDHQEFLLLDASDVVELLQSDELNVSGEVDVFRALQIWVQYDEGSRQRAAADLLSSVRLPFLTPQFLADRVEGHRWFKCNAHCQQLLVDALKYHLMPERRTNMTICRPRKSTVGRLLCVGGMDANRGATTMEQYDSLHDVWSQCDSRVCGGVVARLQFDCCVIDDYLCVIGGRDGLKTLAVVECCRMRDTGIEQRWTSLPPMGTPRHGLGVAVLAESVYACGGHDGWAYLSSVERYDPETSQWTYVADMNHSRSTAGFAVLEGRLYGVGGRDSSQVLRSVERYNPHTNKWTLVAPMNKQRSNVGVGVLNGNLYAVGGIDAPASCPGLARFNCVERYDPHTNTWSLVASLPGCGRDGVSVATLGDRLFVVGGFDGHSYVDYVHCYCDRENQWTQIGGLNTGRAGSGLVVFPNRTLTANLNRRSFASRTSIVSPLPSSPRFMRRGGDASVRSSSCCAGAISPDGLLGVTSSQNREAVDYGRGQQSENGPASHQLSTTSSFPHAGSISSL